MKNELKLKTDFAEAGENDFSSRLGVSAVKK
jgi:hypothetical protein